MEIENESCSGTNGLLSGFPWPDLQRELEAKQRVADEIQEHCDQIDAMLWPFLKDELATESAKARMSTVVWRDFKKFKTYCLTRWTPPLPYLPAKPQAVVAFLIKEKEHGTAHINRLCKSISVVHSAAGLKDEDPISDVLVRAYRGKCAKPKSSPQHKGKN